MPDVCFLNMQGCNHDCEIIEKGGFLDGKPPFEFVGLEISYLK